MGILRVIWAFLRAFFTSRAPLAAENMMLRQQLIVVQRSAPRPKFCGIDRVLLCWLSRLWTGWKSALLIVQPDTVVGWHRQGFKLYWRWKSRRKQGAGQHQRDDTQQCQQDRKAAMRSQRMRCWHGGLHSSACRPVPPAIWVNAGSGLCVYLAFGGYPFTRSSGNDPNLGRQPKTM